MIVEERNLLHAALIALHELILKSGDERLIAAAYVTLRELRDQANEIQPLKHLEVLQ